MLSLHLNVWWAGKIGFKESRSTADDVRASIVGPGDIASDRTESVRHSRLSNESRLILRAMKGGQAPKIDGVKSW